MRIQHLESFQTKVIEDKLHISFAYQHLTIIKDDELYRFIPLDGKEMVFDLKTYKVENVSDIFVFQSDKNGSRFMRIPLHQLMLVSNIYDYLLPIIEGKIDDYNKDEISEEINELMKEILYFHQENLIDKLLEAKDFDGLKAVMESTRITTQSYLKK